MTAEPLLLSLEYIADLTDEQILKILAPSNQSPIEELPPDSPESKLAFMQAATSLGLSVAQAEHQYKEQLEAIRKQEEAEYARYLC